jgi:hypothetical protein
LGLRVLKVLLGTSFEVWLQRGSPTHGTPLPVGRAGRQVADRRSTHRQHPPRTNSCRVCDMDLSNRPHARTNAGRSFVRIARRGFPGCCWVATLPPVKSELSEPGARVPVLSRRLVDARVRRRQPAWRRGRGNDLIGGGQPGSAAA